MPAPTIYGTSGPDTITGTAGDDTILGEGANDVIHGGDGNDYLNGGYDSDKLYGDSGDDFLDNDRDSFARLETFDGGVGNDTLRLKYQNYSNVKYVIDLGANTFTDDRLKPVARIASIENLQYMGVDLTLTGSAADNQLHVFASAANIDGQGGNDVISVGSSDAVINGGEGNDWLLLVRPSYVEPVNFRGFTVSLARPGVAQATGYSAQGRMTVSNIENLAGTELDDKLIGNAQANVIAGLEGNDWLIGGAGNDTLLGETRSSVPTVPWTQEEIGYLFQYRSGPTNNDLLEGGLGDDRLFGGIGYDTITYANAGGSVTVDLAAGKASGADGNDEISGVEAVIGSAYADTLTGNAEANLLDGAAGADTLAGGGGDDTYGVDSADDRITEQADGGDDTVRSSVSWVLADELENITLIGSADIDATGNAAANVLTGNAGRNRLVGGAGDDIYVITNPGSQAIEAAGGGHDTVRSAINMTLGAELEDLELIGNKSISGTGNALDNTITGNRAGNRIDGGLGADTMAGGVGNDTYYIDNPGDRIIEVPNEIGVPNRDQVFSSITTTLSEFVENLTLTGTRAINAYGNATDNVIIGNDAANILSGGGSDYKGNTLIGNGGNDTLISGGLDTLRGGTGNDTYIIELGARAVVEKPDEGIDTIKSKDNFGIPDNIENAVFTGTGNGAIRGNALDNRLTTGSGSDYLDGKVGADIMVGGAGRDTYIVDNIGDRIIESAIPGDIDTVYASVDYTMPANVEVLYLSLAVRATGNTGANEIHCDGADNIIDGGRGADRMYGAEGNDTYYVDNVGDVVVEDPVGNAGDKVISTVDYSITGTGVENLTLTGKALRAEGSSQINVLVGNARNNEIIGNGGADTMIGGAGNDHYVVSDTGTRIEEKGGEGLDTVTSSVSYTLSDNIENLELTGGASDATGNALGNRITGNAGNNRIDGRGGADTMIGGGGSDVFIVDNAGDTISGTGRVEASTSFALSNGLSDLKLTGTQAIDGTGNDGNNVLTGNSAANQLSGLGGNDRLDGGAGADIMDGGLGDDTYFADTSADKISEAGGGGLDRVITTAGAVLGEGIEAAVTTGSKASTITGNAGDNLLGSGAASDTLNGGDGNDTLVAQGIGDILLGGAGDDTLIGAGTDSKQTGGTGADAFVGSYDGSIAPVIMITDFVSGVDRLVLVNPSLSGQLLAEGFTEGTAAKDLNDIAIYDKASGALYVDLDANGPDEKFLVARFTPGTSLAANDIQLISTGDFTAEVGDTITWLYSDITL
ncbi:MAG: calcium-binding protein [Novosphingobium sp.]|uniref:calcium-binding protein n=1 Tax=Novosphingobium sp. TaxID=1874826 RepID=UPI003019F93A